MTTFLVSAHFRDKNAPSINVKVATEEAAKHEVHHLSIQFAGLGSLTIDDPQGDLHIFTPNPAAYMFTIPAAVRERARKAKEGRS